MVNKISSGNLIHWYDASDLATVFEDAACTNPAEDGDGVGCLKDKAGSDDLVQANSDNQPVIVYDGHKGKPVLKFSGNQLLKDATDSTPGFSGNHPYQIFMVVNVSYYQDYADPAIPGDPIDSEQALIHYGDKTSNDGEIQFIWDNENGILVHSNLGRDINYAGLDKFTGQMTTLRFTHEGGANNTSNKSLAINGDLRDDVSSEDGGSNTLTLVADKPWSIGALETGEFYMRGSIAEILIFDKSLDPPERASIEAYLMKKWQHGLDGINTTGLVAHYDASKSESLLAGAADCTSSALSPASNSQIPGCWRDRSAMDNHLFLGSGNTPTLTTSSSMISGQRAVSFDPGDFLGLYSGVRGFYEGDMAYNMGTLFGSAAFSSNNQLIVNFGEGAETSNQTPYLFIGL